MNSLPCIDCITMTICKLKMRSDYNYAPVKTVMAITKKCYLIDQYIFYDEHGKLRKLTIEDNSYRSFVNYMMEAK